MDVTDPGWEFNGAHNWNGGGLHTSHDFGFGLIDTLAGVRLAETWTAQSTAANESLVSGTSAPNLALIDQGTIFDTITIGGGVDIEHVEVVLNLTHTFIGDLFISLTSPDGTESVLVNLPPTGQDNINFTLSSTHHWGEIGAGDWTLEIQDQFAQDTGFLVSWTLNLFGTTLSDDDFYVYTNEFAGFTSDLGRQILSDAAGADVINAAAITTGSFIDLNDGADSTLAGNTLTIEAGTIIEDVYSGDGDDSLIGNAANNLLSGGRGDDTLTGAGGNDTLDGGAGDDLFVVGTSEGDDVIQGFVAGAGLGDQVDLQVRSDVADFAELLTLATDDGSDTTIAFANGDSLVLNGILESELAEDDFLFGDFNSDPTAIDDNAAATEDTPVTIFASALLANDSDPDLDPLTIQSVQNAANGTAALDVNGDVLFTPDANFNGNATFDYTVDDGNGGTDTATVTVAVAAVNDDPTAVDDNAVATEDTPLTIFASALLANDSDPDLDPLTIQSVQNAVNGTAALDVNGDVLFTPDANFNGNATFDYTADDGNGGTDTATVTVNVAAVNDDPVAANDIEAATEDTPVTILASSLLANDTDIDGGALTIQSVQNAANGTATLDVNGDVLFTPDANFNGNATFDYTVDDGNGGTDMATVTVNVAAVNDDPVAANDIEAATEDTPVTILASSLLANDTDIDGGALTIQSVQNAANGTAALDVNGDVLFTPDANFNGNATFDYTVGDGNGGTDTATVTVNVAAVNDDPVAANDIEAATEDTPVTILASSLLANDTDIDGGALSIQSVQNAVDGTATLDVDGDVLFTPDADFNGVATFDYTVGDGNGGTDTATVTVNVAAVNDDPVAADDIAAATEDTPVTILASSLLANDTDIDGGALSIQSVQNAVDGTATLDVDGDVLFAPDANFNGAATFEYTVGDGNGGTDTATVTVNVSAVNDDPVAADDIEAATEDTPVTILASSLLANDTDIDGGALSIQSVQNAVDGTATLDVDGNVLFTPDANFNGAATFEYTVDDGNGGTDTATVTVNVAPVNDNPVAVADVAAATQDTAVTITAASLLLNDSDIDGDPLSLDSVQNAVNGTASLDGGGDVLFTPDAGFNGAASFDYTVADGNGGFASTSVAVDVAAANVGVTLTGGTGKDTLVGGEGDDAITGNGNQDVLVGNGGNDTFFFAGSGNGFDIVTGGDGLDRIAGSSGDDVIGLRVHSGIDTVETIDGGTGTDVIAGSDAGNVLDFSGTVLLNIDAIDGGLGKDTITGSAGADTIIGGANADILIGGQGNDVFVFSGTGNGHDMVSGGDGLDRIEGSSGDDVIGLKTHSGIDTVETIDGGMGTDVIVGSAAGNVLDFSGTVLLNIDAIDGGNGKDTITGSAGDDTIIGGDKNDQLSGGAGNDRFIFRDNDDNDTINNFVAGAGTDDAIDFAAVSALNDFVAVQANATDNGSDTTIDYGSGSIVLIGVQVANLHEDDFIF